MKTMHAVVSELCTLVLHLPSHVERVTFQASWTWQEQQTMVEPMVIGQIM